MDGVESMGPLSLVVGHPDGAVEDEPPRWKAKRFPWRSPTTMDAWPPKLTGTGDERAMGPPASGNCPVVQVSEKLAPVRCGVRATDPEAEA
jgi:hypothetical protein